jgi:hypothetical protein
MIHLSIWLLSTAIAGESASDDASRWYADQRSANADFLRAYQDWSQRGTLPAPDADLDTQQARRHAQDARLVEQQRLRELDAAELALRAQRDTYEALVTVREAELRGREQAAQDAASAREVAFVMALEGSQALSPSALRALERMRRAHESLEWKWLFDGQAEAVTWQTELAQLELTCGDEEACVAVIDAIEAERRAQLTLYRGGPRAPTEQLAAIQVELADLETNRQAILGRIHTLSATLDILEAQPEGPDTLDPNMQELRRLSAVYADLANRSASLEAPLDARVRCEVFMFGGIARLAAGEPGALDMFSDGISAWSGACRGVVLPFMEAPEVQRAWSEALYTASQREGGWLVLGLEPGEWRLDGLPIFAHDHAEIELAAGVHRIEHQSIDGRWHVVELELRPGERAGAWMGPDRLVLVDLPPGTVDPPRPERLVPVSVAEVDVESLAKELSAAHSPASRLSATAGATWIRLSASDTSPLDCLGLSVGMQWQILQDPRAQLLIGLTHDHTRAPVHFDYADGYAMQVYMQDRLSLVVAGVERWQMTPRVEVSVGVIPLAWVPVAEARVGGELSLSPTWSLQATAGLHSSWWADNYRPSPRPTSTFAIRAQL